MKNNEFIHAYNSCMNVGIEVMYKLFFELANLLIQLFYEKARAFKKYIYVYLAFLHIHKWDKMKYS